MAPKYSLFLIAFLLTMCSFGVNAQIAKEPFEAKQGYLISVQYGLYVPGSDLADRFGWNSGIGVDVKYKFENGWTLGGAYTWGFGRNIQDPALNMFDSITGASGEIIDEDGLFSVIRLNERVHSMAFEVGKIIPLSKQNRNSGILIQVGVGAMLHRIDIYASTSKVPQITGDYEKGYDRLTGGLMFNQFVGYQHLDPKKQINFNIGFVAQQAFTKSMRTTQFDSRERSDIKRNDMLNGFRVGITLPIYTKKPQDEQYFTD